MPISGRKDPRLITLGWMECHALSRAFAAKSAEFKEGFSELSDPDLARRLGESLHDRVIEEAFVPTQVWRELYAALAYLGLEALEETPAEILPCEHSKKQHEEALKKVLLKLNQIYKPN